LGEGHKKEGGLTGRDCEAFMEKKTHKTVRGLHRRKAQVRRRLGVWVKKSGERKKKALVCLEKKSFEEAFAGQGRGPPTNGNG